VTTEVGSASAAEPDLRSMLEQAEAEAAAAEAAAAEAQAKVRAMRSEHGDEVDLAEPREPRRLWPPSWPVVAKTVAALVIVAALIGSGYIVWNHYEASAQRQNEQEFIDTAKQGVVDLTSIDFKIVKDQVKHIIDNATGSFRDDFIARADQFIKVSEASKAVAKGTVSAAAVESLTPAPRHWWSSVFPSRSDEAVVLVVGSEEITNAVGNQQPRAFRFRVTVTREAGQLKVSKLELVL